MKGSIFNKGTKGQPRWYAKHKGIDGKWKMTPTNQPTKPLAFKWLEDQPEPSDTGQPVISVATAPTFGELAEKWKASMNNRSAEMDRKQIDKHVVPAFRNRRLADIGVPAIMAWLDDQRAQATIAEATQRHNLNFLSRFFSWAIERGHTSINPVRMIPVGKRPRQSPRTDQPWLNDDELVGKIMKSLAAPAHLMFYLGNRSGLRTGEICGLRLSDLGFLNEGIIRARFSYDGPLKEDKDNSGKVKWVPAPDDAKARLEHHLKERRDNGAQEEDLVFLGPEGTMVGKKFLNRRWTEAKEACGISLTWYQATRHSFVSRNLSRGANLDEVSAAVGHSSPTVTKRYYDHFIRKTFSKGLRESVVEKKEP